MSATLPLPRFTLPAVGILLSALGVLGLVRSEGGGWGGFIYSPRQVVEWVEPGSAAEAAGLLVGDTVLTVDGRPAADLPMQSRWANTRAGETHRLVVRRAGQEVAADVVYRPRGPNPFAQGAFVFCLAFLWCGLFALLTVPTPAARALGWAGLAAGVAMAATPNVGGLWNGVLSHVQMTSLVLVGLFLLRFFVTFPAPKRIAGSRLAAGVAVAAWVAVVALVVVEMIVHPRLYRVVGNIGGFVTLGYIVLAIAALVHSLWAAPRGTLWRSGLGWTLLGVGLMVVAIVTPLVGAAVRLPGAEWTELLFVVVPFTLVLAVRQHSRTTA